MSKSLTVAERRRQLGRWALLTLREACELLQGDREDNRALLMRAGVVMRKDDRPYVLWGQALDAWIATTDEELRKREQPAVRQSERPRRRKIG